jgi:predicted Zn-dependent protease
VARSTETQGFGKSQSFKRTLAELGVALIALVILFLFGRFALGCAAESLATQLPLSIDEQIGKVAAEQMRSKYDLGRQPTDEQIKRVDRIFAGLQKALTDEAAEILKNPRVTVVVDEQVNAFALPGGEVFVLTGLLERVGEDDDLIRGVLAHELGHAIKRHGIRGLARKTAFWAVVAMLVGDVDGTVVLLAEGASQLDGLSHSRGMETEADLFGVDLLKRAGHDPDGLARFLESLDTAPVPELLSTHPDPSERAAAIRKLAKAGGS